MHKFIKLVVLFSIPILIGIFSLEFVLRNIPNNYSYKRKYLDEKSNDIEVLFLGNSHIYYGINPEYMRAKSFNAAQISQSLNFDLAILEKYRNNWAGLKYIVIPIDYFSLYTTLETGIEKWRVKNYHIYYKISKEVGFRNTWEVLNGKLPVNISRAKAYLFNRKNDVTCNKSGYGTNYKTKAVLGLAETGMIAAKRHTVDIENNLTFSENKVIIQSIIDLSKKQNVKIIFVTCPVFTTYKEKLKLAQLNNTINAIKQITAENINTCYYSFLSDTTFVANDFFDADHLNEIGTKKFTLKIDQIVNSL